MTLDHARSLARDPQGEGLFRSILLFSLFSVTLAFLFFSSVTLAFLERSCSTLTDRNNRHIHVSFMSLRYMSHKFHGKGPGKNKVEKRMKKMEQDAVSLLMIITNVDAAS